MEKLDTSTSEHYLLVTHSRISPNDFGIREDQAIYKLQDLVWEFVKCVNPSRKLSAWPTMIRFDVARDLILHAEAKSPTKYTLLSKEEAFIKLL